MFLNKKNLLKFLIMTFSLFILDILSKYLFYNLKIGTGLGIIEPSLNLGIAWSLPMPFLVVVLLSILALFLFFHMYFHGYISSIIASFLIAGTLGNVLDRIFLGGVRDFININILNFPIFNMADIFLSIGLVLFFVKEISSGKNKLKH